MPDPGLWTLFSSAFISSTLLPGGSEALLAWLVRAREIPAAQLWLAATLGNSLGALTSWGIGWWLARRFPARDLVKPAQRRAVERVRRWGSPLLLLSWLPVVGDPLCVAAGWLRISLPAAILFIALGKGVRYALIVWVFI